MNGTKKSGRRPLKIVVVHHTDYYFYMKEKTSKSSKKISRALRSYFVLSSFRF